MDLQNLASRSSEKYFISELLVVIKCFSLGASLEGFTEPLPVAINSLIREFLMAPHFLVMHTYQPMRAPRDPGNLVTIVAG